ncbi:MAG: heme-binding domain-containing protein [Campylobacterota bacterium]|nr:heme-binding domain-containing protein [Campylobacterota bacterium]
MKTFLIWVLSIFIILQFIPAEVENQKTDKNLEIKVSTEIMSIFKKSCYDCHSNEVKIPWYSKVAPVSFTVSRHVNLGRKWLNFSIWESYTQEQKDKKLKEIYRAVYRAMPLGMYTSMHKEAILTKDEINLIRDWTGKAPF